MFNLISVLLIAVFFYAIIPLAGAFSVRKKWRIFRRRIIDASICRDVTYSVPDRKLNGLSDVFRFTGELQAIQEDSTIWLNNGKVTVRAEMNGIDLYLLPASPAVGNEDQTDENKPGLALEMPSFIRWESVYSLAQGTGFFISGEIHVENGTPVFRHSEENPLLVIIYDGSRDSILQRSIWNGRQINEYWNHLTPFALMAGSFFLFVIAFIAYNRPDLGDFSIKTGILSLLPVIPFFPPGIVFYFLYRKFWKAGRYLRGERDLLILKLKSSNCEGSEKIRSYISRAKLMELLAAASISIGFIINIAIIYFFLVWVI